jgi:hypothetical protein
MTTDLKQKFINNYIKDEPNKRKWVDENTGYFCEILRHPDSLHLCGYVVVHNIHPFFDKDYEILNDMGIKVHGGLTYGNGAGKFGFDCCHYGDLSYHEVLIDSVFNDHLYDNATYRNWDYVKQQVLSLASQLEELENFDFKKYCSEQ